MEGGGGVHSGLGFCTSAPAAKSREILGMLMLLEGYKKAGCDYGSSRVSSDCGARASIVFYRARDNRINPSGYLQLPVNRSHRGINTCLAMVTAVESNRKEASRALSCRVIRSWRAYGGFRK